MLLGSSLKLAWNCASDSAGQWHCARRLTIALTVSKRPCFTKVCRLGLSATTDDVAKWCEGKRWRRAWQSRIKSWSNVLASPTLEPDGRVSIGLAEWSGVVGMGYQGVESGTALR